MYDIEREKVILDILEKKGTVGVNRLAHLVYCSGSTIRRDLTRLEKKGLVKRTFGAVSLANTIASEESSFSVRENVNVSKKKALAREAANQLKSNLTIFIDSSTTLYHIVPYLNDYKNLLIITNGLKIAAELTERTSHKVVMVGGEVMPHSNSTLGSSAVTQMGSFHADVAIMSCTGVSFDFGFSEASYDSSQIKRQMIRNSTTRIMVFDESKFDTNKAFKTCDVENVDIIVVPYGFKQETKEKLIKIGVKVIECAKG